MISRNSEEGVHEEEEEEEEEEEAEEMFGCSSLQSPQSQASSSPEH